MKDLVLWPFSNPTIELALIMLVIPFFVNLLIFWVTDNFLMRHDHHKKSMLINYVSNGVGAAHNGGPAGLNGKSDFKKFVRRSQFTDNNFGSSNDDSIDSLLKTSDSELDQLISGDENFEIDDVEMFVGDRIALEKFGQGIGSSNVVDPSSSSPSARRNHPKLNP